METSREQTLEALETFIQLQKTLLAQQHADIERLRLLKVKARKDPQEFITNLEQELDDRAFRLSEQGDCRFTLLPTWDWAAFENADTTPLRTFAHQIRDKILQRTQPCIYQQSPLSDLQKIVKEARVNIVDPVLAQFQHLQTEEESDPEPDPDPEETRKEQERAKIRELKKRKIRAGGLKLPSSAGWGSTGVFIRHDVDDETMEVDMDIDVALDKQPSPIINHTAGAGRPLPPPPLAEAKLKSNPKRRENHARQPPQSAHSQPPPQAQPEARPLKRVKIRPPARSESPSTTSTVAPTTTEEVQKANAKESRTAGKPKPETYKQAWSVSEQNLLEQLLEQVPEGEKFRWQKISRAMGGRRTPRQVASRVQKYFQKLKKFGIGVDLT